MVRVMVGGTFNIFHKGHEFFLREAKKLGDELVVVIACDKTVLRKKGYLLKKAEYRKKLVEESGIADKVVVGDEDDFFKIVKKEKPDIVALGYDQRFDTRTLKRLGCKVVRIAELPGHSTKDKTHGYKGNV